MDEIGKKILTPEEGRARAEALRGESKRIVQCHGCFDIVHPGHIRYLRFAKSLGDVLVVSVSGDDVVHKGWDRPYVNEELRAENLASLTFVDYVIIDHHDWAGPILETIEPDVYVKGREYEQSADPRFMKERELVEKSGGEVVFSSGDVVFSSTEILSRDRGRFGLEAERARFFCKRHDITAKAVDDLLRLFSDKRVVVVGDPILDVYVHCESATVASESPVLNVTSTSEAVYVGGAGLVARQLRALGASVTFVTTAADGPEATAMIEALGAERVTTRWVGEAMRPVFVKRRYLVEGQKVFKVNHGAPQPPATSTQDLLEETIEGVIDDHDALVVSDFGYGLFGPRLSTFVSELAKKHGRPYYADVSQNGHANLLKFHGPRLASPTETELRFALADAESGLSNLAANYYRKSSAEGLVLTLGKRGAIYFAPPKPEEPRLRTEYLPALASTSIDNVGAGDAFLAALVLADLCEAPAPLALYVASLLSAHKIQHVGNDPVEADELLAVLPGRPELVD